MPGNALINELAKPAYCFIALTPPYRYDENTITIIRTEETRKKYNHKGESEKRRIANTTDLTRGDQISGDGIPGFGEEGIHAPGTREGDEELTHVGPLIACPVAGWFRSWCGL